MITNAERDEIRTQAENYIREVRLEFKLAELGDRIDGTTRETGAGDTRTDEAAAEIGGRKGSGITGSTPQIPTTAGIGSPRG